MSDTDKSPREFIVSERKNGLGLSVINKGTTYHEIADRDYFYVIEHSAYLAVKQQLAEARKEIERLKASKQK